MHSGGKPVPPSLSYSRLAFLAIRAIVLVLVEATRRKFSTRRAVLYWLCRLLQAWGVQYSTSSRRGTDA
jgi:hypothetical protein